jgi:transcription initiation factor IIE alpha subunit
VNSPAQVRTCPHCGSPMVAARTVPSFGILPELNIFRCSACDEVLTIVESATSLVQIRAEMRFI